jgi:hypothetical protein
MANPQKKPPSTTYTSRFLVWKWGKASENDSDGDSEGGSDEDVNELISKLAVLTILRVESGDEVCIH